MADLFTVRSPDMTSRIRRLCLVTGSGSRWTQRVLASRIDGEGETMHPNEELARRELEALESGDMDTAAALYTDYLVLHYPGRDPLAGDHRDLDGFLEKFRSLLGEDGTITRELHDARPDPAPGDRPARVFDIELPFEEAAAGYRAMDERRAIKV